MRQEIPGDFKSCHAAPLRPAWLDQPDPDLRDLLELLNETWVWGADCENKLRGLNEALTK